MPIRKKKDITLLDMDVDTAITFLKISLDAMTEKRKEKGTKSQETPSFKSQGYQAIQALLKKAPDKISLLVTHRIDKDDPDKNVYIADRFARIVSHDLFKEKVKQEIFDVLIQANTLNVQEIKTLFKEISDRGSIVNKYKKVFGDLNNYFDSLLIEQGVDISSNNVYFDLTPESTEPIIERETLENELKLILENQVSRDDLHLNSSNVVPIVKKILACRDSELVKYFFKNILGGNPDETREKRIESILRTRRLAKTEKVNFFSSFINNDSEFPKDKIISIIRTLYNKEKLGEYGKKAADEILEILRRNSNNTRNNTLSDANNSSNLSSSIPPQSIFGENFTVINGDSQNIATETTDNSIVFDTTYNEEFLSSTFDLFLSEEAKQQLEVLTTELKIALERQNENPDSTLDENAFLAIKKIIRSDYSDEIKCLFTHALGEPIDKTRIKIRIKSILCSDCLTDEEKEKIIKLSLLNVSMSAGTAISIIKSLEENREINEKHLPIAASIRNALTNDYDVLNCFPSWEGLGFNFDLSPESDNHQQNDTGELMFDSTFRPVSPVNYDVSFLAFSEENNDSNTPNKETSTAYPENLPPPFTTTPPPSITTSHSTETAPPFVSEALLKIKDNPSLTDEQKDLLAGRLFYNGDSEETFTLSLEKAREMLKYYLETSPFPIEAITTLMERKDMKTWFDIHLNLFANRNKLEEIKILFMAALKTREKTMVSLFWNAVGKSLMGLPVALDEIPGKEEIQWTNEEFGKNLVMITQVLDAARDYDEKQICLEIWQKKNDFFPTRIKNKFSSLMVISNDAPTTAMDTNETEEHTGHGQKRTHENEDNLETVTKRKKQCGNLNRFPKYVSNLRQEICRRDYAKDLTPLQRDLLKGKTIYENEEKKEEPFTLDSDTAKDWLSDFVVEHRATKSLKEAINILANYLAEKKYSLKEIVELLRRTIHRRKCGHAETLWSKFRKSFCSYSYDSDDKKQILFDLVKVGKSYKDRYGHKIIEDIISHELLTIDDGIALFMTIASGTAFRDDIHTKNFLKKIICSKEFQNFPPEQIKGLIIELIKEVKSPISVTQLLPDMLSVASFKSFAESLLAYLKSSRPPCPAFGASQGKIAKYGLMDKLAWFF